MLSDLHIQHVAFVL